MSTNMPSTTGNSQITAQLDQVRICTLNEYKDLALSLAHAFKHDEVAMYFIDTPDRAHWTEQQKWDLHLAIMEYVVYAHLLTGLVTTIGENYGGVALWMPPGKNMDSTMIMLRSGMWRLYYQLSAIGRQRFFTNFLPLLHETKTEVLGERDDDSWYLVYIGTRPEARGKKFGRKLIEDVTKQADREGRACYLESSNVVNVGIYERLEFEQRKKIVLEKGDENGNGCIELDIMVREPRTWSE